MVFATMMLACQRQGTANANLDKDEEHDLVVAQELSNTRVHCIAEDASGQLWIGTFRGLNRYDGHEYHQYFCTFDSLGLPDNHVLFAIDFYFGAARLQVERLVAFAHLEGHVIHLLVVFARKDGIRVARHRDGISGTHAHYEARMHRIVVFNTRGQVQPAARAVRRLQGLYQNTVANYYYILKGIHHDP